METVIKTDGLTKKYGSFTAVKSLNLNIVKGEIYGFIGLNGAGKTTTIRMLLGMIKPTEGAVELFGEKISSNSINIWSRVGFLVETASAYPELTVTENIDVSRRLYQLSDRQTTSQIMEKLNITKYKDKKASHLSLGNYQRLAIAKALLHKPELLILDEPTNGLDPAGIVEIRYLLQDLAKNEGVTVFISSHILGEIYRFTTKIGIIHEGELIEETDIETLDKRMGERLVLDAADRQKLLSALTSLGYSPHVNEAGEVILTERHIIEKPENIIAKLVGMHVPLSKVNVQKEDLEEYFLSKVGRYEKF